MNQVAVMSALRDGGITTTSVGGLLSSSIVTDMMREESPEIYNQILRSFDIEEGRVDWHTFAAFAQGASDAWDNAGRELNDYLVRGGVEIPADYDKPAPIRGTSDAATRNAAKRARHDIFGYTDSIPEHMVKSFLHPGKGPEKEGDVPRIDNDLQRRIDAAMEDRNLVVTDEFSGASLVEADFASEGDNPDIIVNNRSYSRASSAPPQTFEELFPNLSERKQANVDLIRRVAGEEGVDPNLLISMAWQNPILKHSMKKEMLLSLLLAPEVLFRSCLLLRQSLVLIRIIPKTMFVALLVTSNNSWKDLGTYRRH